MMNLHVHLPSFFHFCHREADAKKNLSLNENAKADFTELNLFRKELSSFHIKSFFVSSLFLMKRQGQGEENEKSSKGIFSN